EGEPILSIIGDDARFTVIVCLPGQYRPMLRVGTPLRLALTGYRGSSTQLTVEEIGDQVVGPAEIRRYLGPELGDALPLEGAGVLVRARLPAASFTDGGKTFEYFEGMQGMAEARVRSESILLALVPGLRALFGG